MSSWTCLSVPRIERAPLRWPTRAAGRGPARGRAIALLTALALAAPGAPVLAAPTPRRIFVAPPSFTGVTQAPPRDALTDALTEGLQRADLPISRVRACSDPPECYLPGARAAKIDYLVFAEITAQARDYAFKVALIEVASGRSTTIEDACSICGLEEAALVLEALGPRLRLLWETAEAEAAARRLRDAQEARTRAQEAALAAQPRLQVTSQPAGAILYVDDLEVGVTPLTLDVRAGAHSVRIELRRHVHERREVNLSPGTSLAVDVTLARADGRMPPTRRSRAMLAAGAALGGLGVVSLGVMAAGLGIGAKAERDGAAAADRLEAMGVTGLDLTDALAEYRDRGARANALAWTGGTAGAVLLIGGATLIGVSTTKIARRVAIAPIGGARVVGLGISGRF
ncbi:MAG: PEGA domain-containing protein [Nannocystaceae bacterium]